MITYFLGLLLSFIFLLFQVCDLGAFLYLGSYRCHWGNGMKSRYSKFTKIMARRHCHLRPQGGGGGGTSILKVTGTCRWTGYDFAVINISTGYLVALFRSSILAQGILWPSCAHQYWHRVSKSA